MLAVSSIGSARASGRPSGPECDEPWGLLHHPPQLLCDNRLRLLGQQLQMLRHELRSVGLWGEEGNLYS